MKIHNFKELQVWQKSIELAVTVYRLTTKFPYNEKFGLAQQVQRSVVSISSNIAEGCGRGTTKDLQYFLTIAMGSSFEADTQMILAERFGYITNDDLLLFEQSSRTVQKMLYGFYNHFETGMKD